MSVDNREYTVHIPIKNVDNIYKICDDIGSRVSASIVCSRKNITNDIALYIAKFMEGWVLDVPLH